MNPKLGDVGFKVGGKNYILNMGVNAMCCAEQESGVSATELFNRLIAALPKLPPEGATAEELVQAATPAPSGVNLRDIRVLFWAGLQRHHPGVNLFDAGDLIQVMNKGERKAFDVILESITLCSPDQEDANAPADPPPAAAEMVDGTGTASS